MTEYPHSIPFDEALAILRRVGEANRLPVEDVPLSRAHGRVLARDLLAPIALQPFDNSAMDGYACRHADLAIGVPLRLVGEQFAGRAQGLRVGQGECVRITTGAPMPEGADTVVIREQARVEGGGVLLSPPAGVRVGANVRRAGEDCRPGDRVLAAGTRLNAAQVAVAASLGIERLPLHARPTVAVFTTGDELVEPGLPLRPGEIYNGNRELLLGLLRAEGLEPVAWPTLPDDPARIAAMLLDAASSFDLVLTCGGVSAGEKDHLPGLLQVHGQVHFWKVRIKPGMPLLAGRLGQAHYLGLPGNPVSVLATWLALGRPLLDALQGLPPRLAMHARLATPVAKPHARREFLRGRFESRADGGLWIHPDPVTGSHRLRAAAEADALLVLPEGPVSLAAGDVVEALSIPSGR